MCRYHVPLIVRHPGAECDGTRGRTVGSAFTESVDVMPTILEAIGSAIPAQADGQSLLPFLAGGGAEEADRPASWRDSAVWEFDYRQRNPPVGASPYTSGLTVLRGLRWKCATAAATHPSPLLMSASAPARMELLLFAHIRIRIRVSIRFLPCLPHATGLLPQPRANFVVNAPLQREGLGSEEQL